MEIRINIIEAAAEIAEERVISYFANKFNLNKYTVDGLMKIHKLVYVGVKELNFTERAQDLFCMEYDSIFEKLIDSAVEKDCIKSALEDAVSGLEWKKKNTPNDFDKADSEKLYEWKKLLEK